MSTKEVKQAKASRGRPRGSNVCEDVVDKAGAAFVKHGYHGCTVEHILQETGVSRTNFYRFFKNKESVFEALFSHSLANLQAGMEVAREEGSKNMTSLERADFLLEHYLLACFSKEELLPILMQESLALPRYREIREKALQNFAKNIAQSIERDGFGESNALLIEGFMAAVDRIVLLESQTNFPIKTKVSRSKAAIRAFLPAMISK